MTQSFQIPGVSRRVFLGTGAAVAGATALPFSAAMAAPKYRRYNVASPQGQKALASYARGVAAMLKLPPEHPHNWFRNAFVHFMDCPHGNWWFYVWHRGFLGYFERTIRELSGDAAFAIPYWDWTGQFPKTPHIPDGMFNGVLTPRDAAYEPFTANLDRFTKFIQPTLLKYWAGLSAAQRKQLDARGYTDFSLLWNDVTGAVPNADPNKIYAIAANIAFAPTCGARYLTRDNPNLDDKTAYDVSDFVVTSGLLPTDFYNPQADLSFTSTRTPSHNTQPASGKQFSTLEGMPHNKVHNYLGGYGPLNYGPYGNMTNNLSPVDPIFFLHHSNMDRLWDVWTRKQKAHGWDWRPAANDAKTYYDEQFLFFIDEKGRPVANGKAGDYFNMDVFDYDYEPGFGEKVVKPPAALVAAANGTRLKGSVKGNTGSVTMLTAAIQSHMAAERPLMAEITLPRPSSDTGAREFDVLVNAPPGVTSVAANSPYYAGTIAFFGHMSGMNMAMDTTFAVPLPRTLQTFSLLSAAPNAAAHATTTLNIRVVPTGGGGQAPALKGVSVGVR